MGRVSGKVAFITGAARGQGRSHAVRLAEEGADIIAVDLCRDVESLGYSLATPDDLAETARLVRKAGQQVLTRQADVRDAAALEEAVLAGIAEFGGLDIVVAQAGIAGMAGEPKRQAWCDTISTNLVGTINAIQVSLPHLQEGASIIATGSTAGLMNTKQLDNPGTDPGGIAYALSKRMLSQYVHELAAQFGPSKIRANVIHPTNCNTPMLHSEPMYKAFRPDLENPTREEVEVAFPVQQVMPIPYVEPEDISEVVVFLASDESRYVTGMQMRVDAGGYLRWYDFHL
ncbi:mycofactocin-coupled SDR family oxidoreductase [Nocardia bovistercoris]|uniref:Mycofactocin-coupled SDR family oxidoreductase n=1 Tax=Nocardia bovistercoris TaxID=2785916 RepID=A0A931I7X7_9NOCA|nr:mycofactocin-coupled SDR family oxidoreductase [Nocardia bovistercoris]MBH0776304.1 mycofactocin-coupled SDR family oxidoreductase [Nocardia bovistercoris]